MLTLVPTPIGNIGDISKRAIPVLQNAQVLFCEDTRVSKRLLALLSSKFDIVFGDFKFISLHSHNELQKLSTINKDIFDLNCVYLSDAGMPAISDPGFELIKFCQKNSIKYDVLPGANAALVALVLSGFDTKHFSFYGFLSHKGKERSMQIANVLNSQFPIILYEAPTRILKLIKEIALMDEAREIFAVKEISKLYQNSFKGDAKLVLEEMENSNLKGEWVVVVKEAQKSLLNPELVNFVKELNIPKKEMAKIIAKLTNKSTKECYGNLCKP
jgi:16S rRNA (cytidine1402-2'-O)-methyltransferase